MQQKPAIHAPWPIFPEKTQTDEIDIKTYTCMNTFIVTPTPWRTSSTLADELRALNFRLDVHRIIPRCPFDFYAFYTHIFQGLLCSWTGVMIFGLHLDFLLPFQFERGLSISFLGQGFGNLWAFTSLESSFWTGCPFLSHPPSTPDVASSKLYLPFVDFLSLKKLIF